jgi:hypothetical protein
LFAWLNERRARYVVLRGAPIYDACAADPVAAGAFDLDLLVDDVVVRPLLDAFGRQRSGVKTDVYGLHGLDNSGYHGFAHLPEDLGERLLSGRVRVDALFPSYGETSIWVPEGHDELLALVYHVCFHKPEQSGIPVVAKDEGSEGAKSDSALRIGRLVEELDVDVEQTLCGLNRYIEAAGFGVDERRLIAYLQHDFRHYRKSFFHALLQDRHPGEMNLFVIRKTALVHRYDEALLDALESEYEILWRKPLDWWTRRTRSKHMRGGKWRRGGKPHLAVVVFDPEPIASSEADRRVHPFVFNRRQFAKQVWRQRFCDATRARSKDNPIHSTDNEAEAFGHLPLFFDAEERDEIYQRVCRQRDRVTSR